MLELKHGPLIQELFNYHHGRVKDGALHGCPQRLMLEKLIQFNKTGSGLELFFEFLLPIWNECIGPCKTYVWRRSQCILGFIFTLSDRTLVP